MHYFIISLITGLCLLALLLMVFFKAGTKNKKQRALDLQLVQSCNDEGLLRLYEQAESENERDGIVEFIKEKLAEGRTIDALSEPKKEVTRRSIPGVSSVLEHNSTTEETAADQEQSVTDYGEPGATHMLALETVDWRAIEHELQQKREEESRIMAQNQQIQEVFLKIKEVEDRLIDDMQAKEKQQQ